MKRFVNWFLNLVLGLLVTMLVLLAVVIGIAREVVYDIDSVPQRQSAQVLEWIEAKTNTSIAFDRLRGSWQGLAPRFEFHGLTIRQSGATGNLSMRELDVELLLLSSLMHWEPRLKLRVRGLQATLTQTEGRWHLAGFKTEPPSAAEQPHDWRMLLDVIMAQPLLQLDASSLTLEGVYPETAILRLDNFRWEADREKRYVQGSAAALGPGEAVLEWRGVLQGSLADQSLAGDIYLNALKGDWEAWLPVQYRRYAQATLDNLEGGGEFWLRMRRGEVREFASRLRLEDLFVSSSNEVQPPKIRQLDGTMVWRRGPDDGWALSIQNMTLATDSFVWEPRAFNVAANHLSDETLQLLVNLDEIEIAPWLQSLLSTLPPDSPIYQLLSDLDLRGRLNNVFLDLQWQAERLQAFRYTVDISRFYNNPVRNIPGLEGVELTSWGDSELIYFYIDDHTVTLNYPHIFREPLELNQLEAQIQVAFSADEVLVQSDVIRVASEDLGGATQFSLTIPRQTEAPPFLQLQATIRDGDGSNVSHYLPYRFIDAETLSWLDQAILAGDLMRGDIVVHGPVDRWNDENLGVVLGFTVEEGVLRFLPDWQEPIRNARVDVVVDDGVVDATVVSGTYFDQQILKGEVDLIPTETAGIVLNIKARTEGKAQQGVRVLIDTPLHDYLEGFIEEVSVAGQMQVDLDLEIPLSDAAQEQMLIDVDVGLDQGRFQMPAEGLDVTQLKAAMHYDLKDGFDVTSFRGNAFGGPVSGRVKTRQNRFGSMVAVDIDASGTAGWSQLKRWQPLWFLQPLEGKLDYRMGLHLPLEVAELDESKYGPRAPWVKVTSDLRGTVIDMPEPLSKSAAHAAATEFWMSFDDQGQRITLQYNDWLSLALALDNDLLSRGAISLHRDTAELPEFNRLTIDGDLGTVDVEQWYDRLDSLLVAEAGVAQASNQTGSVDGEVDSGLEWMLLLDQSRLRIDELVVAEQHLKPVELSLARTGEQWQVTVINDQVNGQIAIPVSVINSDLSSAQRATPLEISLDYLVWKDQDEALTAPLASIPWEPLALSPVGWPPVRVAIEQLRVSDLSLGQWRAELEPNQQGLAIEKVVVNVGGAEVQGAGSWYEEQPGLPRTRLTLAFTGEDIGDLMTIFADTPVLSSEHYTGSGNFNWPGAPFEFDMERLGGSLNSVSKNGQFYDVSSNAADKLWGALNFETLVRRLQLNFDDISGSDMVYDSIRSDFDFADGKVVLNAMKFNLPAITMNAGGSVDLTDNTLDVDLDVTIPVTRNLVLPAVIFGGLPAAAAALVVEKMFGDQLDKLTTLEYHVSGSLEEPLVKPKATKPVIAPGSVQDKSSAR